MIKKGLFLGLIGIFTFQFSIAQNITNEEIWKEFKFFPKSISGIESMLDGEHYTILGQNGIEQYSYKTSQKVKTIKLGQYSDYQFNKDETWLLLESNPQQIYRRSKKATYTLYNIASGKEYKVFNGKPVQEPTLSPDGKKVAFMAENNLYFQDIESSKVVQFTTDGKVNSIINGITDWVYEEEFAFVRAFDWNGNSDKIAFIRFDESQVPEMGIDIYGKELYQTNLTFKYPKAGEKNSDVSVHIYDLNSKITTKLNLHEYRDFYVPKIEFNHIGKNDGNDLFVFVSNRHQNKLDVLLVDADSYQRNLPLLEGEQTPIYIEKKLFTETDKAYIEIDHMDFIPYASKNGKETGGFLWSSERDGNRHVYDYDYNGKVKNQLTKGNWGVTSVYGYDSDNKTLYYQSHENGSTNRGVYKVKNGKTTLLSPKDGVNTGEFSSKYQYFINQNSTGNTPPKYTLRSGKDGKEVSVLEDNAGLSQLQKSEQVSEKEYFTINVNNETLNAWMIKPKNFDASKQYPLFMYQYSGPGSQETLNEWDTFNYWWFQSLAQQGIIVACVDGRGTGAKGRDFKKVTYKELGKYEIEDQIASAKYFGSLNYIDTERIGMFGWSYGGYMTLLALTKGADVFKAGISVAPVTNWRYYDTVYTERFMRTPQENASGYDDNSPINHTAKLKGNLLLVHGSGDDNVHVQNTMQMVESLVQHNKDFELFIYPDKNHGIYGGNTRLHLYNKMTNFLLKNL